MGQKEVFQVLFFLQIILSSYIDFEIQGRHGKSGQKEFLSHTLKNEVICLIFLYFMKKI